MKSKKKNPIQDRSKLMVDSIREGAARILEGKVSGNFTTNKIAEVAGVSIGSLYQYYKNKESIIEDILFNKMQKSLDATLDQLEEKDELTEESFIESIVQLQFAQWKDRGQLSKNILRLAPKLINPTTLYSNNDRIISFIDDKIKKYQFVNFREEHFEMNLVLSINSVRVAVYTYFTDYEKYDYDTFVAETAILLKKYLLK